LEQEENKMAYEYLMFDLDGTLTDPGLGITNSVMYALEKIGIHETDREKLYPFIGPPLLDSFQKYYGLTREQAMDSVLDYREYFSTKGMFENEPYPGIHKLLERLRASGKRLFVATSKPELFAKEIMEHFGLAGYFEAVSGPGMDGESMKKSEIIRRNLRNFQISDLEHTVMIGDREHDIIAARESGVQSIGVLYGYGSREELLSAGAGRLAASLEELEAILLG